MLEIIYRVYQVASNKEKKNKESELNSFSIYSSISNQQNIELTMDCMICESRDAFKEIIKSSYGKDTRFAYSKKMLPGQVYCIIIGEHCWNGEKYFNLIEFECDYCHSKVKGFLDSKVKIDNYELNGFLLRQLDKYGDKKFCCSACKERYLQIETSKICEKTDGMNMFITKDMFSLKIAGYIYKITKKSTGEFYIGQTLYAPVFRWGQHLKTTRFDIKNILDYQFETIELVPLGTNILEREKYWIQKYYKENPKLSLNISQTKNISTDAELGEEKEFYDENNT